MSEKDFKQFRAILEKQQREVKTSKDAARELLLKLGLLNSKGNLKKTFKSAS
jgi:hypothetical protein